MTAVHCPAPDHVQQADAVRDTDDATQAVRVQGVSQHHQGGAQQVHPLVRPRHSQSAAACHRHHGSRSWGAGPPVLQDSKARRVHDGLQDGRRPLGASSLSLPSSNRDHTALGYLTEQPVNVCCSTTADIAAGPGLPHDVRCKAAPAGLPVALCECLR